MGFFPEKGLSNSTIIVKLTAVQNKNYPERYKKNGWKR